MVPQVLQVVSEPCPELSRVWVMFDDVDPQWRKGAMGLPTPLTQMLGSREIWQLLCNIFWDLRWCPSHSPCMRLILTKHEGTIGIGTEWRWWWRQRWKMLVVATSMAALSSWVLSSSRPLRCQAAPKQNWTLTSWLLVYLLLVSFCTNFRSIC